MKRFLSFLAVLLMLMTNAHADTPLFAAASERLIYAAIHSVLAAEEIIYEPDDEYHGCYFSFELENSAVLGHADMALFAFSDGMTTSISFYDTVPEDRADEVIRLCNCFNSGIYVGKFYLDQDRYLCYELFRPLNALSIDEKDKEGIADDVYLCASILEYYAEYFGEVIHNGEKAEHVYAMWMADEE